MPIIKTEYLQIKMPFKVKADVMHPQFLHQFVIDPYKGCSFACQYCWVLKENNINYDDKGQRFYIGVKTDILYHLNRFLKDSDEQMTVLMSAESDPYQPQEERHMLTRMIIETLLPHNWPLVIATKSDLILRDIELLEEYNEKSSVTVLVSLCSLDTGMANMWERYAPSPKKRLGLIERLSARNIPTGVSFMPIMPHINDSDENLKEIFSAAKSAGAEFVLPSVLLLNREKKHMPRIKSFMEKNYQKVYMLYDQLYRGLSVPDEEYCGGLLQRLKGLSSKYKIRLHITPDEEDEENTEDTVCIDDDL